MLLYRDQIDSYVHLLTDTVPFLEFSIEFQSNNLTFQQVYTNRQKFVYHLIRDLHNNGLGYRKISQKLNSWGIKTQRDKQWFNTSVYSVLKRKDQIDLLTEDIRNKHFPTKISEFKVKYYSFE
jgi:hypothetical protein